jgi:hypothetical protein
VSAGKGLTAGVVGTELLNVATYLDMALRGRGASSVPQDDVQALAERTGLSLGEGETAENRKSAVGTLLGYATGASVGLAYGLARPVLRHLPTLPAAVLVGVAAMAATDATSAALGTTDPRSWSPQDWVSDLVPHLAYGLGVVATHDALDGR